MVVQWYHHQSSGLCSMDWSTHSCASAPHQARNQSRVTTSSDRTGEWWDSRWTRREVRKWGGQGQVGDSELAWAGQVLAQGSGPALLPRLAQGRVWALLTSPSDSSPTAASVCSFLPPSGSELELPFQCQFFQGRLPSFYPEGSTYQRHHSFDLPGVSD